MDAVLTMSTSVAKFLKEGATKDEAFNRSAMYLMTAAKAHANLLTVNAFYQNLNVKNVKPEQAAPIETCLVRLFCMFCLSNIMDDNWG